MYHNIEKSAFRSGEYVGYASGKVFNIRRMQDKQWRASQQFGGKVLHSKTLKEMSRKLEDC